MYPDDKVYYFDDVISIIVTLAILWRVCRQFSVNGYRFRVWIGSDANLHPKPVPIHTKLLTHPP